MPTLSGLGRETEDRGQKEDKLFILINKNLGSVFETTEILDSVCKKETKAKTRLTY